MSASTIFLQTLINGLVLGTLYILIASGFAVVFGMMRVVNFVHGEFYMLGGFLVVLLFGTLRLNFVVALALTVLIVAIFGALIERFVFRPFCGDEPSVMITDLRSRYPAKWRRAHLAAGVLSSRPTSSPGK